MTSSSKHVDLEQARQDIHRYLEDYQQRELLRFVVVGSVDDGKSTLIGRLLHDTGQVFEDQLEDARRNTANKEDEIDFSLLTDGLRAEREQGITIDVAYRYFSTARRKYIIADTPGHVQYTRNMATGASTADVAVILIDARLGVQQQSRRHAYIASLLGIPHLVVAINKMDAVGYQEDVYQRISEEFSEYTKQLDFKGVLFFPVSAKRGDNIVTASAKMPWYQGKTLMEHLETVPIRNDRNFTDFRLPVQYVIRPHQDYRGFAGQIASGVVRPGDPVMVLPSLRRSRIKAIDTYEGSVAEAFPPMSVTLRLEDEVDVSRGDILTHPDNPPHTGRDLDAIMVWMHDRPLDRKSSYLIKNTTQTVRANVGSVFWKIEPNTLEEIPTQALALNDIGQVRWICHRPMAYDAYRKNRSTGAFIVIDAMTNETMAAGMLLEPSQTWISPAILSPQTSQTPATTLSLQTEPTEASTIRSVAGRDPAQAWASFCETLWTNEELGVRLDWSHIPDITPLQHRMAPLIQRAFEEMSALEAGAIANPDEQRQVGHYWLRAPELAPQTEMQQDIQATVLQIQQFATDVHTGKIKPPGAAKFRHFLLLGIGGSALGPQWMYDATKTANTPMKAHFIDNTDPDGFDRTLDDIGDELNATLVLVISKSGGTQETSNAMEEIARVFAQRGLSFAAQTVAITGRGSKLDQHAQSVGMIARFPIWDWVGGRTSLFSAVGLLPAALLGIDIERWMAGAAAMDRATRTQEVANNPAMLLALCWYAATEGRGKRAMVLLPYKDRLGLYSRYVQQLVMESLGKELDRESRWVCQGLTVYGNKGSTDQHALVQQLREGPDDFFVLFLEVLQERQQPLVYLDQNVTSGDHLLGFQLGTRLALSENRHPNLTLTLPDVSVHSLGQLVALFERAVGYYATLIGINAYHQPGVEAGKRAAKQYIQLQQSLLRWLQTHSTQGWSIPELAQALDAPQQLDALFYIAEHLVANGRIRHHGQPVRQRTYQFLV